MMMTMKTMMVVKGKEEEDVMLVRKRAGNFPCSPSRGHESKEVEKEMACSNQTTMTATKKKKETRTKKRHVGVPELVSTWNVANEKGEWKCDCRWQQGCRCSSWWHYADSQT